MSELEKLRALVEAAKKLCSDIEQGPWDYTPDWHTADTNVRNVLIKLTRFVTFQEIRIAELERKAEAAMFGAAP